MKKYKVYSDLNSFVIYRQYDETSYYTFNIKKLKLVDNYYEFLFGKDTLCEIHNSIFLFNEDVLEYVDFKLKSYSSTETYLTQDLIKEIFKEYLVLKQNEIFK